MKKILGFFVMMAYAIIGNAQNFKMDSEVRTGKLDNGLTYYIRHHAEPRQRAYFYIAQKVGAIQEEPQQRGLAHFLEHMAFNGTKHFPGTSLRSYLEEIGVKFGNDLNAYTATDETVYNIDNVPTSREGAIDSCLLILHDWSHFLTLADKDIDEERGVIHEEWRSRNSASQRMAERMLPVIMANSKYSDAMPIGNMDIVMNFKPQTLRDYYEKWYRPDLQGIVVVGDIDVNMVEKKIKKIFADIAAPAKNAAKRVYYPVPDNDEPIVFIGKDKEMTSSSVTFYFKHDVTPRNDRGSHQYAINKLYDNFAYEMFHDHTRDIAQTANSPFSLAYLRIGDYYISNTKKALSAIVSSENGKEKVLKATEAMLRELFRVRRHGFTASEFDRYRKDMLSALDRSLKNKDKRQSGKLALECVRHFLDNEPLPSIEEEVAFWKETLPKLKVEDMNRYFSSLFNEGMKNVVIAATGPEKDSLELPTAQELLALYKKIEQEDIAPYVDVVNDKPFLPVEPTTGSIVKKWTDKDSLEHYQLSNGVRVVVKKTSFKEDEILMQSMAHGGLSTLEAKDYKYGQLINMMTAVEGWGNYNLADMNKAFIGVNASIDAGIADNYQSIAGSSSVKDLGVMLQQAHAAFLYPHKDSEAFGALVKRLRNGLAEGKDKPQRAFADSLSMALYGNNPYCEDLTEEELDNVDYDKLLAIYRQMFSNASDFTFTFVGNVDNDSLEHYLVKYIASLPVTGKSTKARPIMTIKQGTRSCEFEKEEETPKSTIAIYYTAPNTFNRKDDTMASILGQILNIIYTKTIREEAGAAYSVGVGAKVDYYPQELLKLIVRYTTDPKSKDLSIKLVDDGLRQLAEQGPDEKDLAKVKEYLLKIDHSNRSVNSYWQYVLSYEWNHGFSYSEGYIQEIKNITANDIQTMAKKLLNGSQIKVVMSSPQNKK